MYGDPADFFTYPDDVAAVPLDDVQRVARNIYPKVRRTVGYLMPTAPSTGDTGEPTIAALRFGFGGAGAPALQPFARDDREPDNRAGPAQPQDPVVAARLRIGLVPLTIRPATAWPTSLPRCCSAARNRSREKFEDAGDELGASIGINAGRRHTEFTITCLAEDFRASRGCRCVAPPRI